MIFMLVVFDLTCEICVFVSIDRGVFLFVGRDRIFVCVGLLELLMVSVLVLCLTGFSEILWEMMVTRSVFFNRIYFL